MGFRLNLSLLCFFATILLYSLHVSAYQVLLLKRRRNGNTTLTPIETHTDTLFKILDEMPENELFHTNSCDVMEQEMPDFRAPERRISEVKCLEHLWKIRFYDQLLLKKVRCKTDLDGAYVTFAIYKGKEASTGTFSHAGAIGWNAVGGAWIFLCSSVLISGRFMLTAAHCSTSHDERVADPSPKIVRIGEDNILDSEEYGKTPIDVNIKNFIVHNNYRFPFKYFDIALIELEDSIPFRVFSRPSCIWSNNHNELFGRAYEAGWGIVESDKTDVKPAFQISDIDIMKPTTCDGKLKEIYYTPWTGLTCHQICANYTNNDTCNGDSGGPLMMPIQNPSYSDFKIHYIIGVECASYGCDSPGYPNIYTKVSSFIDWIEEIVWEEEPVVKEYLSEKNFAKIYERF